VALLSGIKIPGWRYLTAPAKPAYAGWAMPHTASPLPDGERGGEPGAPWADEPGEGLTPYRRGFPVAIVMFAASCVILLTAL